MPPQGRMGASTDGVDFQLLRQLGPDLSSKMAVSFIQFIEPHIDYTKTKPAWWPKSVIFKGPSEFSDDGVYQVLDLLNHHGLLNEFREK